jgi:hypothetical protein
MIREYWEKLYSTNSEIGKETRQEEEKEWFTNNKWKEH